MREFREDALTRFLQENGLLNVSAAAALAMAEARSAAAGAAPPAPAAMDFSLNVTGIRPLESEIPEEEATEESIEAEEEENTFAEYVAEPIEKPDSNAQGMTSACKRVL